MKEWYGIYPYHSEARAAVAEEGLDISEIVSEDSADYSVVERAIERVTDALDSERIGAPSEDVDARTNLLAYPMSRILVSLLDDPVAISRYVKAESATAFDRLAESDQMDRHRLLQDFELETEIQSVRTNDDEEEEYVIGVGTYLELVSEEWGVEWQLFNRGVVDGEVRVTDSDVNRLVQSAIEQRVADGLPFTVPDGIADGLTDEVAVLEETIQTRETVPQSAVNTVLPEAFPDVIRELIAKVKSDESMQMQERYVLLTFFAGIGMSGKDAMRVGGFDTEIEPLIEMMMRKLQDENLTSFYDMPSYGALIEQGIVEQPTEPKTETPLSVYAEALEDRGDVVDAQSNTKSVASS